jgi:hypothetical protein
MNYEQKRLEAIKNLLPVPISGRSLLKDKILQDEARIRDEEAWTPNEDWLTTNGYNIHLGNLGKATGSYLGENYQEKRLEAIKKLIPGDTKPEENYITYPVNLDEGGKNLIRYAVEPAKVNINLSSTDDVMYLPLTRYQITKIRKAQRENETSVELKFSTKQLKYFKNNGSLVKRKWKKRLHFD